MPGSSWKQHEIIEDWGYAMEIDSRELQDVGRIAARSGSAAKKTIAEDVMPDIDISPEILDKLLLLVSRGYLKLSGKTVTSHSIYGFVEALNGNEAVYALYANEEDNTKSSVRMCDLSIDDVPFFDDLDGLDYKLRGVYASQEEAEGEM